MARRLPQRDASLNKNYRFKGNKYLIVGFLLICSFGVIAWTLAESLRGAGIISTSPEEVYQQPSKEGIELTANNVRYEVIKIIDGDTIDIQIPNYGMDRIRIKNIDTPEIRKAACPLEKKLALEAKYLAQQLLTGTSVILKTDPKRDQYGRTLAHVILEDGRDLGQIMLDAGLAVVWPQEYEWCRYGKLNSK